MTEVSYKRFYVKICAGPQPGGNPCIYHNIDFPYETFQKWRWYFDYRAALYKVKHPRHYVDMTWGSYDYIPPAAELIKDLKNKIIGKKRKITEIKNKIDLAVKLWNQLFPIQDDVFYKKAILKVRKLEFELRELENDFKNLE